MRTRQWLLLWLVMLVFSLSACLVPVPVASPTATCVVAFEATVQQGPDTGLALIGDLTLTTDATGAVTGTLVQADGTEVNATGQVNGRAIHLVFALGNDQYVFGVGSLQYPFQECRGAIGGPFTGPQPGDSGDWGYALGG